MNKQTENRMNELCDLGLKFNGSDFIKDDFNINWTEITCDTDEVFNKKIESIKKEMERRKTIKNSYNEGECPDCGEPLPEEICDGYECVNCGHFFISPKFDGDN